MRLRNSGLCDKKKRAEHHSKPTKSQVRTGVHYYSVTFFGLAGDFKMVFKELIYIAFGVLSVCKCNFRSTLKQLRYKVRKVFEIIKSRFDSYSQIEILFECK